MAKQVPCDYEIDPPVVRPLKAYAFDPAVGRLLGNEMSMNVRYQHLEQGPVVVGPVSSEIAIVDYDGARKKYYKPVNLDDPRILIRGGLDPSEGNPQFHQQMVYAVVNDTIQHFERALGRRIHWRRAERRPGAAKPGGRDEFHDDIYTLTIFPHAFVGANAFYSPRAHGIFFGYFRAGKEKIGNNLPGQAVFTCLSHDIVVHETTHAIVDGIRAFFTEQTNPDVAAFHEALADLAALFRHFSHREVLRDTIQRSGGMLYRFHLKPDAAQSVGDNADRSKDPTLVSQIPLQNPLVGLAQQFGEATGRQRALREALGTKPDADDIHRIMEPHRRGAILVAAVFDAFFAIYLKRTADLWRIYRAGGGNPNPVDVPPVLAERLCSEATHLADEFFTICVRALDYCPPVDITFGTYLRAVITADLDLHPIDPLGVRHALMQAFRSRGIVPEGAGSFSEGAIAWPKAKGLKQIEGLEFGDANGLTRHEKDEVRRTLQQYVDDPANRASLCLDPHLPVAIPSFHPTFRILPDGSLRTDMVVELVQTKDAPFVTGGTQFGTFPARAGATIIIQKPRPEDQDRHSNVTKANICYVISRSFEPAREIRQRRIGERLGLLDGTDENRFMVDFSLVHQEV